MLIRLIIHTYTVTHKQAGAKHMSPNNTGMRGVAKAHTWTVCVTVCMAMTMTSARIRTDTHANTNANPIINTLCMAYSGIHGSCAIDDCT